MSVIRFKKKTVVVLITVAVGSGILVVCTAQSATNRTESKKSSSDEPQSVAKLADKGLLASGSNFSDRSSYYSNKGEFFFRAMLAILFVVVLGAAAIYVSKKLLPQIAKLPGKEIRVVETVHLGPRKAVHVLEIGNQRLLIGSTDQNVTNLADITKGFVDLSSQELTDIEE